MANSAYSPSKERNLTVYRRKAEIVQSFVMDYALGFDVSDDGETVRTALINPGILEDEVRKVERILKDSPIVVKVGLNMLAGFAEKATMKEFSGANSTGIVDYSKTHSVPK